MAGRSSAEVVVCGAGIAGISAAFHLIERGVTDVVLVDPEPPLSVTSDKSTEAYRNWWPGPGDSMVALMNRSIDLLEHLDDRFAIGLNRRGYVYAGADPVRAGRMAETAAHVSELGGGELRVDDPGYRPSDPTGWRHAPGGADLITDPGAISRHFPYLASDSVALLHARRAGWLNAHHLGSTMLEEARRRGLTLLARRIAGVEVVGGMVEAVDLDDGFRIETPVLVNAAGPLAPVVAELAGEDVPLSSELHLKMAFRDRLGVVPRTAPMLIWSDPQQLAWSPEERRLLAAAPGTRLLLEELPIACHGRPEGGPDSRWVLALWEYRKEVRDPTWPFPVDGLYGEVVIRGLSRMLPGLTAYLDHLPQPVVDGGYYTKTPENRPLAGPGRVGGSYLLCGLGGFGVMAAPGAGDLVAAHIAGDELPPYAPAFELARYDNPEYVELMAGQTDSGQL